MAGPHCRPHLFEIDARGGIRLDPAQRQALLLGDAFDEVPVGGKVVRVRHDLCALRVPDGGQRGPD